MVDYWYCVDDNSCEEDRQQMRSTYPWLHYIWKTPTEKGHRQSMNMIYNKLAELKPTLWIHMEDDFLFHAKLPYISMSIEGLSGQNVQQIVWNRNYAETIECYGTVGHAQSVDPNLALHVHHNRSAPYVNCHYWPHYSFRPSMTDVATILALGNFDSPNQFFEMDYAKRWTEAGHTTAFLNRITHRHIGRLTKDRGNKDAVNAYSLNAENQFTDNIKKPAIHNPPIKIINLERRPDRKEKMINTFTEANIDSATYEFIKATDGKVLTPTFGLAKLFQGNDFGNRRGVIGCALTHFQLWMRLLADPDNDYYVIMEDDITLCPNFSARFQALIPDFQTKDTVFLGYHMFEANRAPYQYIYDNDKLNVTIHRLNQDLYIGGYFAYSLHKTGAKKLVDYINKNGIKHGIDYLNKVFPDLESYECQPQLVFSVWNESGKQIDTDIQNNGDAIDFSKVQEPAQTQAQTQTKKSIKKIQLLCNWTQTPEQEWSNMCETPGRWKDLEFTTDPESADYSVIINKPPPNSTYDPQRTIVFQMEPWVHDPAAKWGVKTWGQWANPDPTKFLAVRGRKTPHHNNAFWQLEQTEPQLRHQSPEKTKGYTISSICSSKYFDPGHIARIDFLKFLEAKQKQNQTPNPIQLDIYNYDNPHGFQNYRGTATPYVDKSKGIAPYKYYFMVENNYEPNFITEKLWEPILCETLTFYYGCPNVADHVDPRAYVLLDMNDFEGSYQIMIRAIQEDWHMQRLPYIREAKQKILDDLAFFPTVKKIIDEYELKP
jgi:hypothetical protein